MTASALNRNYVKKDGTILENPRKIGYSFGKSYDRHMQDEYIHDHNDYDEAKDYYKQLILENENELTIIRLLFNRASSVANININGLDLSNKANLLSLVNIGFITNERQSLILANELDSFQEANNEIMYDKTQELNKLVITMKDLHTEGQQSLLEIYNIDSQRIEKVLDRCRSLNKKLNHEYRTLIGL